MAVLVERGVRLNASANSFQHTAVRGKGGGALEAVQQTNLTNVGSYQAVWQRATIESARRQACWSVDKIELGRTESDCETPKLGVGELDTAGPGWQQPTSLTNAGSYQAVWQRATLKSARRQAGWSVNKIELGRTESDCGRAGGHLNSSRGISGAETALMLAPGPGRKPRMGCIDGRGASRTRRWHSRADEKSSQARTRRDGMHSRANECWHAPPLRLLLYAETLLLR